MTLDTKQDLDALLRGWPALAPGKERGAAEHEDHADWEGRADAIVRAALAVSAGDATVLAALEAPPPLSIEAGEPERAGAQEAAGEKKMSQENESGEASPSGASLPSSSPPERSKRPSLKSIAERASQSGRASVVPSSATRASSPSLLTPIPAAPRSVPSARASVPSSPLSRPVEAGSEDSGVINLNAVNAGATPEQVAAAEKAKPGSEGLFEDDKSVASASAPVTTKSADVISITAAKTAKTAKAAPKRNNGMIAGAAIALLGVAAAFAIMKVPQRPEAAVATAQPPKPVIAAEAKPTPPVQVAAPTAVAAVEPAPANEAIAMPEKSDAPGKVAAASPGGAPAAATAPSAAKEAPAEDTRVAEAAKPAVPTGKAGDLHSEMARAVGAEDQAKEAAGGTPEPAAGNVKGQDIPEQPPQGSLSSAMGAVMGNAKACVSGADEVSRANVTFSSNGSVSNVSVTGWAASNGKADCIKSALKGAKVGPFAKSTFTFAVTIRP